MLEAVDVEFNLAPGVADQRHQCLRSFRFPVSICRWHRLVVVHLGSNARFACGFSGAFDPTVQPLVELWGFGLSKRSEVTDEDVQALMPHVGLSFERIDFNEVTEAKQYRFTTVRKRDPQTRIDFNGIAQGMTVDLLAELLQSPRRVGFYGRSRGEVRCGGKRSDGNPWRIAIDRPIESEDGLGNANSKQLSA